ncbi:C1 family peptidase [Leptospira sp. GIMC2001]|uniref:C1 family peptidase n=1 Tax=Leptospira sp. GIMC2001 TaxID=1513297 RepID=UPI00234BDEDD|nr:C1 family peptidase [Leptospira sp. GIMC2001]WCL47723.1 cysteine protease [Leptospira sp. GIMC2001]
MKKDFVKKPIVRSFIVTFLSLVAIIIPTYSTLIAQEFDPSSVRSPECKPGTYLCGYIPSNKEIQDAIPLSRSFRSLDSLPSSKDLSSQMPPVGNQGRQNSCIAWATGYSMKSYLAKNTGKIPDYDPPFSGGSGKNVFSPAFIYNQQNGGKDAGLYYYKTLDFLQKSGVASWSSTPYTETDYRKQPSAAAKEEALAHRIKSYTRLNHKKPDDIKYVLADNNVVLFGIIIDDEFYKLKGSEVYDSNGGQSYGGHGMVIVGYDDNKTSKSGKKGAFKFQNSWGTNWGDKGFGWISYSMLAKVGQEAYSMIEQEPFISNSNTTVVPTVEKPLLPPNDLSASRGEFSDKIILTWTASEGAITYQIQRKDPKTDFIDLAYSDSPTFTDNTVSSKSTFLYRIVAISKIARSSWSNQIEGFTNAPSQASGKLEKVVGIKGTAFTEKKSSRIHLTWSEVSGATGYIVSKATASNKWKNIAQVNTAEYIDRSPSQSSTNVYRISAAKGRKKNGDWSDSFGIDIGSDQKIPDAIYSITATDGKHSDKIVVSWDESPGASGYLLFRFNEDNVVDGEFQTKKPFYEDKDPKVLDGKYFYYTAYAYNNLGYSDQSEFAIGRIESDLKNKSAGVALAPPTKLTSNFQSTSQLVNLSWEPVKDAHEYYIFRKLANSDSKNSEYKFVANVPASKTNFTEKFPGKSGDLFFYSVRSKSEFGSESKDSNITTAFWNEPPTLVKKRAVNLEPIPNDLLGRWAGYYWHPTSGPLNLSLEVTGQNQEFSAILKINDKTAKQFKGTWSQGSSGIRTKGLQLDLSTIAGNANVRFDTTSELGEETEFSFAKE